MAAKNITIREATENDFNDVININTNVYYGIDYLPARYMSYIKDQNRHMYVAEMDNKVVGFNVLSVTDDGTMVSPQAGRVHADYQNKGIGFHLRAYGIQHTRTKVPTLKIMSSTSIDAQTVARRKDDPSRSLFTRYEVGAEIKMYDLERLLDGNHFARAYRESQADSCVVLSAQQAQSLLECQEIDTDKMVPEGMWLVNAWEPYGTAVSNYKGMVKTDVVVTKQPEGQQVVAISFSDFFRCDRGLSCLIHFYSIPRRMESLRLIKSHYLQHLLLVKKQDFKGTLNIWLLIPHDAPLDRIKAFLFDGDQLGMQRSTVPDLVDSTYINYVIYYDLEKIPYKAKV